MRINDKLWTMMFIGLFSLTVLVAPAFADAPAEAATGGHVWWFWPLVLFFVTFIMGILAVLGGVGGGVLFVPIISGFFPSHLDFVRGTGLLVALSGALADGPGCAQGRPLILSASNLWCLPGSQHRRNSRLENTQNPFRIGLVCPDRHHGRYVRSWRRVGLAGYAQVRRFH